jgi:hypothetical protein
VATNVAGMGRMEFGFSVAPKVAEAKERKFFPAQSGLSRIRPIAPG